ETALWNKTGITHLTLDVKNVPKYYEELKPQGVEFLCEPQYTSGTCWVFLKDMDGNLVELIDMKSQYFLLKKLGGIAGYFMRKGKLKRFYKEN
ncbi:VOC family protein, partial [Romboutsia sp.]|uniref:VOC family protein n=1 Tax=Romboutsia sp. TaxID=1965302 RepID=UPI003F36549D